MSQIDWTNPESQVSTNFKVRDCLWLHQWNRLANESDGLTDAIKENLIHTCAKLEVVRTFLGNRPIFIHCMFRPTEYNKLVGGAPHSAHLLGTAADFHVDKLNDNKGCDNIRTLLIPKLTEFNLRMEDTSDKASRNWIHLDTETPHPNRYFKP